MGSVRYENVYIAGVEEVLPEEVWSSYELEGMMSPAYEALNMQPGQLETLTGIKERRVWPKGYSVSDGAAKAATGVLASSGIASNQIGALIYGSVCRERFEPATATFVGGKLKEQGLGLGLTAGAYDIANACLGMVSGVLDAANRIQLGQIEAALVVGCESSRDIVEATIQELNADPTHERYRYSLATFTGGSAAAAVLLTNKRLAPERSMRLLSAVGRSAPEHYELCQWGLRDHGDGTSHQYARTDALGILQHGVEVGEETWKAFQEETQWSAEEIDRTVCHQVGKANRDHILRVTGLEPHNDIVTYDTRGNTGSVAIWGALAEARTTGFLTPGHRALLAGIGSGLNCIMMGIECNA